MAEEKKSGKVDISNEVIGTISGIALSEVPGIAGMKGSFFKDIRSAATGKKDFSSGVEVTPGSDGKSYSIDVHIIIEYDVKVSEIAQKAQAAVKEKIESMTGKEVSSVNIHVVDIKLPETLTQFQQQEEEEE